MTYAYQALFCVSLKCDSNEAMQYEQFEGFKLSSIEVIELNQSLFLQHQQYR